MNDKQAITGKGYGGGKSNSHVQKTDNGKDLNWVVVVLVALMIAGIVIALI